MDKALHYLGLARKGGRVELGEEPVGAAARALRAHLIVVAYDASDHTWRRAKSFTAGTSQQCIRVSYTKEELGAATGRQELALAAFTDPALALAFTEALGDENNAALEALRAKVAHDRRRREEAQAHRRNVRKGKKK